MLAKRTAKAKEIAQTAALLFGQKGYAFTSVEEIASVAGVGKSTVYDYFKNKEALFTAAIMEAAEQWIAGLLALAGEDVNPVQCLKNIARMYMETHRPESSGESKLFVEVLSQTLLQGGVFFNQRHLIQNLYQRVVRVIMDFLLEGVSQGLLRPEIARHAEKIAVNFLAYLDGLTMHRLVAGNHIDMEGQIAFYLEQLEPLLLPEQT